MANTSYTQQRLSMDGLFHLRLRNALAKVAHQILDEDINTEHHEQRANYARNTVLANLDGTTSQLASSIVTRPGIFAFETTWDSASGAIVTASGDLDIESQLSTDWNDLAGV